MAKKTLMRGRRHDDRFAWTEPSDVELIPAVGRTFAERRLEEIRQNRLTRGLLVRVGADLSPGGGSWNGPVDLKDGTFAYVAIPEGKQVHPGLEKPYAALESSLAPLGASIPPALAIRHMHLDPDFEHLTYGDQGQRARQLHDNLQSGDFIAFYAALADIRDHRKLVYALIGLFFVDRLDLAVDVPIESRDINAHSRRVLKLDADDLIVRAIPGISGRLRRCLAIGEYRDRAYRVRTDLIDAWGGLSVNDGYIQRSARLPRFLDPQRFLNWFYDQGPELIDVNN